MKTFFVGICGVQGGAAPGPSGMSCEHLQPLLESERDMASLCQVATLLARGDVVPSALRILRMRRVTALRKPDGGVRGIVVSDVLRRFVAQTMAKQALNQLKPRRPCSSTHCKCVQGANTSRTCSRHRQIWTPTTILSVDGLERSI